MSVEKFSTKYRSKSIDEYVGNELVKTTMLRRFSEEPYPQVLMITGESGCGKTTMARLLSKHIVCENPKKVNVHGIDATLPCNECETCKLMDDFIEDGNSDNLYNVSEMDATISRRAESIDEFIAEASVPSMFGGYQVYIVDECHMISRTGQNSFLKFLEDAPAGKIFIFCTTDPQNVIPTLLTRCLMLEVKKPTLDDVVEVLTNIANAEGISYELGALKLIAERSSYIYRSSINSFENVFRSFKDVTVDNVSQALGVQPLELYFDFFRYLMSGNVVMYAHIMHKIKIGSGFRSFFEELRSFVMRGLYVRNGIPIPGLTDTELKNFSKLFKEFSVEEVCVILDFLDRADESDLETSLFVLGYRGLKAPLPANLSEPEPSVKVGDNDLSNERQVQQVFKNHQLEQKRNMAESSAEEELQELSIDAMANMFGIKD